MTNTPSLLGPLYDAPAKLPDGLATYLAKRDLTQTEFVRAEERGDSEARRLMQWERGILDLVLIHEDGVSPYRGAEYEKYAEFYELTTETVEYARERAHETNDVILKLHYLSYVLFQLEPRGREWIEQQRELLGTYREYIDGCRAAGETEPQQFVGVHIDRGLVPVGRLLRRPGLLREGEPQAWAEWLIGLAEDSRDFSARHGQDAERFRHRWVADYLAHLTDLPPTAVSGAMRELALRLIDDAAKYYDQSPLDDHFQRHVAEVEASLRKHWGETNTHERLTRRNFESLLKRAKLHRDTGNGMLTAHFFREARRVVEEHRQYFTSQDVIELQLAEQRAIEHAVQAGEFKSVSVSVQVPKEMMDFTRDSAESTMAAILQEVTNCLPNREEVASEVRRISAETPLQSMIGRSVIGRGKVLGESKDADQNLALDIEQHALMLAGLCGTAVTNTVINAGRTAGLTVDHLLAPLTVLSLDAGTVELIRSGVQHIVAEDFISALHILVPRFEDALRQHLKALGVDTTEFRPDVGDGTSRTDDASLGALMRRTLPDGRTVKDYLGEDLWQHLASVLDSQTGLNLRNNFAHGLARPRDCTPENAGMVLSLLYLLAGAASG